MWTSRAATRSEPIKTETLARIQGIIFDVDGTLYDQSALRRRLVPRIVAAHRTSPIQGIRVLRTIQAYREAHEGLRNQAFSDDLQIEAAGKKCEYPISEVRVTVEEWFERAPLDLLPRCVYSQIPDVPADCCPNFESACGVFSDYPADAKLSAMGLKRFFSHVLCAGDVGRQKPDPTGITAVARDMGVAPDHTLYIGDRTIDMHAAAMPACKAFLFAAETITRFSTIRFAALKRQREIS